MDVRRYTDNKNSVYHALLLPFYISTLWFIFSSITYIIQRL